MSGFSAAWLDLREPADRAARSVAVLEACARAFSGRSVVSVCDMGAGTGASLRMLAPLLPRRQVWMLVDHDEANLAAARARLAGEWPERVVAVRLWRHDLTLDAACWPGVADLVVASAFFDLVSAEWISGFSEALVNARLPLLATLTFDGGITLDPRHPVDGAVASAFAAHQGRDKGFGPAAGPLAAGLLAKRLGDAGYEVTDGDSPWLLGPEQAALRAASVEGIAEAVGETGLVDPVALDGWRQAALGSTLRIGHRDLFAAPPA